jgi:hypothetical protein
MAIPEIRTVRKGMDPIVARLIHEAADTVGVVHLQLSVPLYRRFEGHGGMASLIRQLNVPRRGIETHPDASFAVIQGEHHVSVLEHSKHAPDP